MTTAERTGSRCSAQGGLLRSRSGEWSKETSLSPRGRGKQKTCSGEDSVTESLPTRAGNGQHRRVPFRRVRLAEPGQGRRETHESRGGRVRVAHPHPRRGPCQALSGAALQPINGLIGSEQGQSLLPQLFASFHRLVPHPSACHWRTVRRSRSCSNGVRRSGRRQLGIVIVVGRPPAPSPEPRCGNFDVANLLRSAPPK